MSQGLSSAPDKALAQPTLPCANTTFVPTLLMWYLLHDHKRCAHTAVRQRCVVLCPCPPDRGFDGDLHAALPLQNNTNHCSTECNGAAVSATVQQSVLVLRARTALFALGSTVTCMLLCRSAARWNDVQQQMYARQMPVIVS